MAYNDVVPVASYRAMARIIQNTGTAGWRMSITFFPLKKILVNLRVVYF